MPFKNIPNIIGPNYGGFIHGVSLRRGFDNNASELTLSIVNESGNYITPQLFSNQTVTIGSLKFNGFVSSYRKSESIGRRILEVTISDYSVVLDKINVILYKRNIPGTSVVNIINKTKTKTVEKVITKVITVTGLTAAPLISISFEKVTKNVVVGPRQCYSGRGSSYTLQNGGYIIIGEEEYTSNSCSLADSSYTFNELLSLLNFANPISGFNDNPNYRASYEGSLRSVLQNWCADYGLGFYWNFNKNRLIFVDLTSGVEDIPDISNDCNILNKTESMSTDGTFSQASMYYYMKEGAAPEQANFTVTAYSPIKLEPIYASDVGITNEDIVSGVLANFHDGLRKYYDIYVRNLLSSVGITQIFGTFGFSYLKSKSFDATQISHLEKLSPGGNFLICYYDEAISTSYSSRMADLVANFIGKYYRINMNPQQTQVACSSSAYSRIETLVVPAPTTYNNLNGINSGNFPLFERGGSFNITQFDFNNLFENIGDITSFMIQPINLRNSPAFSQIISDFKLPLTTSALSKVSIIFIAHAGVVTSAFGGISINYAGYSINNAESLATTSGGSGNNAPCTFQSLCKDEITEEEAAFYAQITDPFVVRPNIIGGSAIPPKQGLLSREGHAVDITIGGKSIRIVTPAEAGYAGYISQTLETTNLISGTGSEKSVVWRGDLPTGESNVKEIRFSINNVTSDILDKQIVNLSGISVIPKQKNTKGIKTITYNCADFISSLPIDPDNGLESFDVSVQGDSLSIDYVYSTRPKTFPKLETTLRQTDSRINRSGFRHRK